MATGGRIWPQSSKIVMDYGIDAMATMPLIRGGGDRDHASTAVPGGSLPMPDPKSGNGRSWRSRYGFRPWREPIYHLWWLTGALRLRKRGALSGLSLPYGRTAVLSRHGSASRRNPPDWTGMASDISHSGPGFTWSRNLSEKGCPLFRLRFKASRRLCGGPPLFRLII